MFKRIVSIIFVFLLSFSACNTSNSQEKTKYTVELGETFTLPKFEGQDSVVLTFEDGEEVKTQFGSFKPVVGKYTAKYKIDGKTKTVEIVCQDTTSPEIVFSAYVSSVATGDKVEIPRYKVSDYSQIQTETVTVYRSNGSVVDTQNGSWTTENDTYTIVVHAEDIYGNKAELSARIIARDVFTDYEKGENVLFSFDDEQYINLIYEADGSKNFVPSIVKDGYPKLAGEKEGNGVLKLSTTENYDDVYSKFVLFEDAQVVNKGGIILRLLVDRDVDYMKIVNSFGTVGKEVYMLKANVWYDIYVNPVEYGYGASYDEFSLFFRAVGGLNVFIDEIVYEGVWKDETLADDLLADFNEEEYEKRVFPNAYNGKLASITGQTSIVDYPKAKERVLQIDIEENNSGFSFMLDEPIEIERVENITIVMDCPYLCSEFYVGAFQGDYRGEKYLTISEKGTKYGTIKYGEMFKYSITTDAFWYEACGDGLLTGIWVGFKNYNRPCTAYINEIRISYWY